jgi:peptide/nickel transport system ATP-binding protein
MALLSVKDLVIHYETEESVVEAVNGISFEVDAGETLGLVGETGAGKTTTALGLLRLIPSPPGRIVQGEIEFDGKDLIHVSDSEMRKIRGNQISMIFQDPMTALNPCLTVGEQVSEVIRLHQKLSREEAASRAVQMLEMVGITAERYSDYPHQFSGGMKQRVVIATALACNPRLLIADEPTTALDVTIQAQVLDMIRNLQAKMNTAMILITHDLGVVAEVCSKVAVIYAGEIVEYGTLDQIFLNTKHPYTLGLFGSLPSITQTTRRLKSINGLVPNPADLPPYCSFYDRCEHRCEDCKNGEPGYFEAEPGHFVRCKRFEKEDIRHG